MSHRSCFLLQSLANATWHTNDSFKICVKASVDNKHILTCCHTKNRFFDIMARDGCCDLDNNMKQSTGMHLQS